MAREKEERNGRLEKVVLDLQQAQTSLVQAQALRVQCQAASQAQIAEATRQAAEWQRVASERFARIESILMEHSRILRAMPDAVREKIGFKPPEPSKKAD